MRMKSALYLGVAVVGLTGWLALAPGQLQAQSTVAIDNDDIGGVVTGPSGPGSRRVGDRGNLHLPTRHVKMVVTDDQGRYVLPDAQGQIQGLGARLRRRRFSQGRWRALHATQFECGGGSEREDRREILSGRLLVCDDENPAGSHFPGTGPTATASPRARHSRPTGSTP